MPLYLADKDEELLITRITGNGQVKKHLETMGFTAGEHVKVVNRVDENVIVKIKGISIALSHELAKRIYVQGERV